MKKNFQVFVTVEIPYPVTFKYVLDANTAGRAADFAIREMKKEEKCKSKRIKDWKLHVQLLGEKIVASSEQDGEQAAVEVATESPEAPSAELEPTEEQPSESSGTFKNIFKNPQA